jgi:hypothetical protein
MRLTDKSIIPLDKNMNTSFLTRFLVAAALSLAAALLPLRAASIASDNAADAAYSGGWGDLLNGGTGFNAWSVILSSTDGNANGTFIGDSTGNGSFPSGGINSAGAKAWGLYANNGASVDAWRSFTTGGPNASNVLAAGQTFSLSMDNGWINGTVGFSLQNGAATNRLQFYFVTGDTNYTLQVNGVSSNSGIGWTDGGLNLSYTQGAGTDWTLAVTPAGGGSTVNFSSTTYGNLAAADISQVKVFNSTAGSGQNYNAFYNNLSIIPEPSSMALILISMASGSAILARRRRI